MYNKKNKKAKVLHVKYGSNFTRGPFSEPLPGVQTKLDWRDANLDQCLPGRSIRRDV